MLLVHLLRWLVLAAACTRIPSSAVLACVRDASDSVGESCALSESVVPVEMSVTVPLMTRALPKSTLVCGAILWFVLGLCRRCRFGCHSCSMRLGIRLRLRLVHGRRSRGTLQTTEPSVQFIATLCASEKIGGSYMRLSERNSLPSAMLCDPKCQNG